MQSSFQLMASTALFATVIALVSGRASAQTQTDAQRRAAMNADLAARQLAVDEAQTALITAKGAVKAEFAKKAASEINYKASVDSANSARYFAKGSAELLASFRSLESTANDATVNAEIKHRISVLAAKAIQRQAVLSLQNFELVEAVEKGKEWLKACHTINERRVQVSRMKEFERMIRPLICSAEAGEARALRSANETNQLVIIARVELFEQEASTKVAEDDAKAAKSAYESAVIRRDAAKAALDKIPPA